MLTQSPVLSKDQLSLTDTLIKDLSIINDCNYANAVGQGLSNAFSSSSFQSGIHNAMIEGVESNTASAQAYAQQQQQEANSQPSASVISDLSNDLHSIISAVTSYGNQQANNMSSASSTGAGDTDALIEGTHSRTGFGHMYQLMDALQNEDMEAELSVGELVMLRNQYV